MEGNVDKDNDHLRKRLDEVMNHRWDGPEGLANELLLKLQTELEMTDLRYKGERIANELMRASGHSTEASPHEQYLITVI